MYLILVLIAIGVGAVSAGPTPPPPKPIIIEDTLGCLLNAAEAALDMCYSMQLNPEYMEALHGDIKLQQKLNMSPEEFEEGLSDSRQDKYLEILKQACYAHVMVEAVTCVIMNEVNNLTQPSQLT